MKKCLFLAIILFALLTLSACAAGGGEPQTSEVDDLHEEIRGLPVEEETFWNAASTAVFLREAAEHGIEVLPEVVQNQQRSWFTATWTFEMLFRGQVDAVAIVKVTDTALRPLGRDRGDGDGQQVATLAVLDVIYGEVSGDTIELRQTFSLYERFIYGMRRQGFVHGGGIESLVRPGGVYLLPFRRYQTSEFDDLRHLPDQPFYMTMTFGALFEIDNTGHLHSHSTFPDFYRFDGAYYLTLREEIVEMARLFRAETE